MFPVCAGAQAWDGSASSWTNGQGTEADPYVIEAPAHLAYLSEQVRAGEAYEGVYFRLAGDLDMGADAGQKFTPIGFFDEYSDPEDPGVMIDDSKYFLGVFDGGGNTIDNVHVYFVDNVNEVGGTGLFACISGGAEVRNLTIGAASTVEGTYGTGVVVGAMTGGTVYRCVNNAPVGISEGLGQGGIVGTMYGGRIAECANNGDVAGSTNVGGIAGFVDRGGVIEDCYNTGRIDFSGFYAGGIVGYLADGSLSDSYNRGRVSTDWSGGAVVGTTDNGVTISNCYYLAMADGATDWLGGITEKTDEDMKADGFLSGLDRGRGVWAADAQDLNEGFPVLAWQAGVGTGVTNAAATAEGCRVVADGRRIYVEGDGSCRLTVAGIDGSIVASGDGLTGVSVPTAGVYVATVSVGGTVSSVKIVVN